MTFSLARANLQYEWRRYLAAVMAVAFSGLLIIVQAGLLFGMFETSSSPVDRAKADIWITSPAIPSVDLARDLHKRYSPLPYLCPEVKRVEEMYMATGDWSASDGSKVMTYIWGVDTSNQSLGFPKNLPQDMRMALDEPGGVLVDEGDLEKLKVSLGGVAEINGKRVRVVGLLKNFRSIGGANIYTSSKTFQTINPSQNLDKTQYVLVSLHNPSQVDFVRDKIQDLDPQKNFRVWSREELSAQSQHYWLTESGAGAGFGFSALLGILVGTAITSQTLRSAILANLREYATLRALGISVSDLKNVVLEQSLWVGVIGVSLTMVITTFVWQLAALYNVAISFPWWLIMGTIAFTILVALGSGFIALKPLYQSEPAELLR